MYIIHDATIHVNSFIIILFM